MKIFSILVSVFLSVAVNAQTDSLQKAKDYIKQRELTDPNMNGAKRSRLKKQTQLTRWLFRKATLFNTAKKNINHESLFSYN